MPSLQARQCSWGRGGAGLRGEGARRVGGLEDEKLARARQGGVLAPSADPHRAPRLPVQRFPAQQLRGVARRYCRSGTPPLDLENKAGDWAASSL